MMVHSADMLYISSMGDVEAHHTIRNFLIIIPRSKYRVLTWSGLSFLQFATNEGFIYTLNSNVFNLFPPRFNLALQDTLM